VEDALYLNLRLTEPEEEPVRYGVLRMTFDNEHEQMVLWGMKYETFEEAVEKGRLKGRIERGKHPETVHLEASSEELAAFVRPEEVGRQFEVDSPLVLRRVGKVSSEEAR